MHRGTTISATQNFTAPQAGFYTFKVIVSTNTYGSAASAQINGEDVWRFQWNSHTSNYNVQFTQQIFVCKGDIVKINTADGASFDGAKFTPLL